MREAICGKAVDNRVRVAELIVEIGPDDSLWKRRADVVDFLTYLIPDIRNTPWRNRVLESNLDRCPPRQRKAAKVVQMRGFLELLLDPCSNLLKGIGDRCARPLRLHDHLFHCEGGILTAAEADICPCARRKKHDHDERDERTVADRPFGKIEISSHDEPESSLTFCPGYKMFTPAVTTTSPSCNPLDIMTAEGS